tara:strand:+ start:3531 stop:4538 length:1008 start_codon:yes stop_codon:yes gene_type:complete
LDKTKQIFIVGNSRSGTTMMGRILDNHSDIFTFKELHFFGQLWSSKDQSKILSQKQAVELCSRLLCIQEFGILNQEKPTQFVNVSETIIKRSNLSPLEVFKLFLSHVTSKNNNIISCNQTPRNVFYINEILQNFPNTKIINMVRDPRDVLLSQKNKWRRRYFGASGIPFREAIRSYFNYHPITISKIWNTSINSVKTSKSDRIKTVRFEDLILNDKSTLIDLCQFLGIKFNEDMLKVPNIGSSTGLDNNNLLGFDKSKIGRWKNGTLSSSEIYICQKICKQNMYENNYNPKPFSSPPLLIIISILTFPFKIFISFLLNLHRIKNIKELVTKRILK